MLPEIRTLPFDQLRTLHRELGALIAEKRQEALEELKEKASLLGFTPTDFVVQKNGKPKAKYRNPDNPAETYAGKGKRPQWLQEKLDQGRELSEFAVS